LRIGIDDLFQRAFPESVPYPPVDERDPDAIIRSYEDRTSFWPLKCRGKLRKKILRYAFDRGLLHPEDVGTITHWYSHTPSSFYKSHPDFPLLEQKTSDYNTETGKVWNINKEEAWKAYWKLTAAHIKAFGSPRLFHTIGLAERMFGASRKENLQLKLFAYRKIQSMLRAHYPDAPLFLASWDFAVYWKKHEVKKLIGELDPDKTIILDYIADQSGRKSYSDWGFYGKFPWIFGIFHGFAPNTEIRGNYPTLEKHWHDAVNDQYCRGVALWPEFSHSDSFFLEYFTANAWDAGYLKVESFITKYCRNRYPAPAVENMEEIWKKLLPVSQLNHWNKDFLDPVKNIGIFEGIFRILRDKSCSELNVGRLTFYREEYKRAGKVLPSISLLISQLAGLCGENYNHPFWFHDAVDIARTAVYTVLRWLMVRFTLEMEVSRYGANTRLIDDLSTRIAELLVLFRKILSQHSDFSLYESMTRLAGYAILNPYTEQTIKSNSENPYCRSQVYELVRFVYEKELRVYFAWVKDKIIRDKIAEWRRPADIFDSEYKKIQNEFYAKPLREMAPDETRSAEAFRIILENSASIMDGIKW
ncbi:MAG: alpha-N-acetylglucosaminidase TIM-barrel domain-containing protein, partial [Victivallaceae bacterium]|nr:alpha-N-acetylglucosaminidase TIM-barrel domain-containing protein [Victivallaceae bacterium]